jgi:D-alanyl-D-alanine carboxypeptidase
MIRTLLVSAVIVCLALLSVGGVSCSKKSQKTEPAFDNETIYQIDDIVEKVMDEVKVPGAIVGVWWEGRGEYLVAFGEADIESGRAITTDDLFKAASTSKTITGNLILQLVGEGKLSLDDALSKFAFAQGVANADRITIRMLLNQTSGLPDPSNESPQMGAVMDADPGHTFTKEEVMAFGEAMPVLAAPGESYHYSNWNYYMLGMIVEQLTGMNLDQAIQVRFADKLGLTHTRLDADSSYLLSQEHSNGYVWDDARPGDDKYVDTTDYSTSWTWAAGSVTTDINDFKLWIEAVADGTLVTPAVYQQQMEVVPLGDGKPSDYRQGVIETDGFLWHNGAVPGYSSYAGSNPEQGITVCVFMNVMPGRQPEGAPAGTQYLPATLTAHQIIALLQGE